MIQRGTCPPSFFLVSTVFFSILLVTFLVMNLIDLPTLFAYHNVITLITGILASILFSILAYYYITLREKTQKLSKKASAKLLEANRYRQAILDGANYSIISGSPEGIITSFNAAAEKMLGYKAEEVVGKVTPAIIHDKDEVIQRAQELSEELGFPVEPGFDVFITKAKLEGSEEREWTYIRKDQTRFPVRLSVTALRDENDNIFGYLGIASDQTEIKKSNRYVELQYSITKIITESTDYYSCLIDILKGIANSLNVDFGALWLENSEKQSLFCHSFWSKDDPSLMEFGKASKTFNYKLGEGLGGRIWASKQQFIIYDIQEDPNSPRAPFAKEAGLISAIGFPILYEGELVGIFEFFSREKKHFIEEEPADFITWLGRVVGMLLLRFRTEASLKAREEDYYQTSLRLKVATESAKIGIWEWDLTTDKILWDERMFYLYEETPSSQLNPYLYWKEHLHPDDLERAEAELVDGLNQIKKFDTVFRIIWHDQSIHYIRATALVIKNEEGTPIKMVGVNWDTTEEKTAEQRLLMTMESSPTGIIMVNTDGDIVLVNSKSEKLFEYSREELLGKSIDNLIPKNARDQHRKYVSDFFQAPFSRKMGRDREVMGLKKNGREIPLEINLTPFKTGKDAFVIASIMDLTEQKKAERIKNEFISMVSHELRTPLTSIQGSLGLAMANELPEETNKLLLIAHSNCGRLVRLINDLLDVEKIDLDMMVFRKDVIDLNIVLQNAIEMNRSYAEQFNTTLSFDRSSESLMVYGDFDRLVQVITNLISNAVKYSPKGGVITLSGISQEDGMIRVSIQDEGSGIPEGFKHDIFKKFSQADSSSTRQKGGTGLGLSICKAIIEKHGGLINYRQSDSGGAVFYFDLPHFETKIEIVTNEKAISDKPRDKPLILHIEDNKDVLFIVSNILSDIAQVEQASSFKQAKDLLKKNIYDLIILDLNLPDGPGIELLPLLKRSGARSTPVIVFSVLEDDPSINDRLKSVLLKSKSSNEVLRETVLRILQIDTHTR